MGQEWGEREREGGRKRGRERERERERAGKTDLPGGPEGAAARVPRFGPPSLEMTW